MRKSSKGTEALLRTKDKQGTQITEDKLHLADITILQQQRFYHGKTN